MLKQPGRFKKKTVGMISTTFPNLFSPQLRWITINRYGTLRAYYIGFLAMQVPWTLVWKPQWILEWEKTEQPRLKVNPGLGNKKTHGVFFVFFPEIGRYKHAVFGIFWM